MSGIIYIPVPPHNELKYEAFHYIISQIPFGKVLTDKVLFTYLMKAYKDEHLTLNYDNRSIQIFDNDRTPYWRYLSTRGLVDSVYGGFDTYARYLEAEGHQISQTRSGKYRVLDYRETMFNPERLILLPAEGALIPPIHR